MTVAQRVVASAAFSTSILIGVLCSYVAGQFYSWIGTAVFFAVPWAVMKGVRRLQRPSPEQSPTRPFAIGYVVSVVGTSAALPYRSMVAALENKDSVLTTSLALFVGFFALGAIGAFIGSLVASRLRAGHVE
jgi:cytochrome c biogenesis protein CcdA